ncbi:MAG: hypothetical protein JNK58_04740 [Phycisphaerae bacterium]|nr:hypothetical protein [Phycisphaerae bacterium]
MKIEAATTKATDRIEVLADRAVYRLERSARAGASRASLEKAANKAKKGFSSPARSGYAQVTREVGTAMIRMRSAEEYTTDLQDDLFFAREVAGGTLEDAVQAARTRVDEALAAVPATP